MADRNFWTIVNGKVAKGLISFKWEPGMSTSQSRKSCVRFHEALDFHLDLHALDISSASTEELGVELSAFNLVLRGYRLESLYQGSKVYSKSGESQHLYNADSLTAKKYAKSNDVGKLVSFRLFDTEYPLEPKTVFYDYIYLLAICENYSEDLDLSAYNCFTDVQATIDVDACQARSVCLYKLMQVCNKFGVLLILRSLGIGIEV